MEENEMMGMGSSSEKRRRVEEEDVLGLPGFRFHPTDEELVGFYLSRKVFNKPKPTNNINIHHLIHQIDIYKYDPWDLPRWRNREKESYFFCKRGRKYRNSIRPNRVTGSGFWKATGIDKPVYSDTNSTGTAAPVIGLKKTLVYYVGCAGKGNKTDWMMHEFRLPNSTNDDNNFFIHHHPPPPASSSQDAEVWTLCRIFQRNVSNRNYSAEWRELAANKRIKPQQISSSTTTNTSINIGFYQEAYISFGDINETSRSSCSTTANANATNININMNMNMNNNVNVLDAKGNERGVLLQRPHQQQQQQQQPCIDSHDHLYEPHHLSQHKHKHTTHHQDQTYDNWDELRSVVQFAFSPSSL